VLVRVWRPVAGVGGAVGVPHLHGVPRTGLAERLRLLKVCPRMPRLPSCPATGVHVAPVLAMVAAGVLFVRLGLRLLWGILAIAMTLLPVTWLRSITLLLTIALLVTMIMLLTIAMLMAIVTVHPITRLLIVAMALSITLLLSIAMLMATVTIHPVTRLLIVAMALLPVT